MQTTPNYELKKPDGTDTVNITDLNFNADKIDTEIKKVNDNKVDKVAGKQLSTEDYTTAEKSKLAGIAAGANNYTHPSGDGNLHVPSTGTTNSGKVLKAGSTAGSAGWVALAKGDVGLGSVDNTADTAKPVSTAQQTAINAEATSRTNADNTLQGNINAEATARTNADALKLNISSKATQAEAEAGTDDVKYMTPFNTAKEINALAPYTSHNRKHVLLETDCLVWEANAYHGSGFRNTAMQGSLLGDVYANHPGCIILCAPPAAAGYGGAIFTNGSSLKLAANDKTEFIFITAGSLTNREILLGFSNTLGGSLNNAVVIDIFQGVVSFTCAKANVLKTNSSIYTCATNTWYRATIQADSTLSSVIAKIYAENSETPLATSTIAIADVPINTGLQIYAASYANTNISGAAVVGIDYISYENTSLAR